MKTNRIVLFLMASAVLTSCASLKSKGSSSFSDSKSPYVKEESAAPKPKSTVTPTAAATTKTTASAAPVREIVVREEKVRVIDNSDLSVYNYYVILGSFKILDNAKNFRAQLVNEGFKPVILENENSLYRISVESCNEEQQARNKIADIRNSFAQYSDVWLLMRKK